MTRATTKIPDWWSESVQVWFKERLSRDDLNETQRERMVRLATDTQMKTVAMGLQRAEERAPEDWDRSVSFLYRAWEAPDIWEARKDKPNSFRDDDLRVLARTCDDFVRVLQKEREMVVHWFGTIDKDRSHGGLYSSYDPFALNPYLIERARERLSALLDTIQGIADAAQHEFDVCPPPEYIELPRKRGYREAEVVFCVQQLLRCARRDFGKPLLDEVASTVTVLLRLDEAISLERVKSIWKNIKGADYDDIF